MRRTSRVSKKPESYVPFLKTGKLNVSSRVEEEESDTEEEAPHHSSDDSDIDDTVKMFRVVPVRSTKLKKATALKKEISNVERKHTKSSGSVLFENVFSSSNLAATADTWVKSYMDNKIAATAELVNFIFVAAGAQEKWLPSDVDLEALESDEIGEALDDMIQAMSSNASRSYPLCSTNKQKHFATNFVKFWTFLCDKLQEVDSNELTVSSSISQSSTEYLLDRLISLSTLRLTSVRHAVCEAALAFARQCQISIVGLRAKSLTSERQLAVESSKSLNKISSKHQAIAKYKNRTDKELSDLQAVVETVFQSIFVHRYKDSGEQVRRVCAGHLGTWITLDPVHNVKDEYLKYIGWLCSDKASSVRLEAVRCIDKLLNLEDTYMEALKHFIIRFTDRFIEIAVGDVEEQLNREMMQLLRKLLQKGFLNELGDDKMDRIDEIVFDMSASIATREQALAFVMDHTEGFDELEGMGDPGTGGPSKKAKHISGAGDFVGSLGLAQKQKYATLLETLTEFTYDHLQDRLDRSDMLVDALWGLPQSCMLCEWSTIIALLLRESESDELLLSSALPAPQAAVLMRFFAASAASLMKMIQTNTACSDSTRHRWTSLQSQLALSLPRLLVRYRDDDANISVLISLLNSYDIKASTKQFQALLKVVFSTFASSHSDVVLGSILDTIRVWRKCSTSLQTTIDKSLSDVLINLTDTIVLSCDNAEVLISSLSCTPANRRKKAKEDRCTSTSSPTMQREDLMYSLSAASSKYSIMCKKIDCRDIFQQTCGGVVEMLLQTAVTCVKLYDARIMNGANNTVVDMSGSVESACESVALDCVHAVYSLILWEVGDVFRYCMSQTPTPSSTAEGVAQGHIDTIISIREELAGVLVEWMKRGDAAEGNRNSSFNRQLQREGFRLTSDLRTLFPVRDAQHKFVNCLVWKPTQEVLTGLRIVFESEGARIRQDLEECGTGDDDVSGATLSKLLLDSLLYPLGRSIVFDVANLNRRQAAAVLLYALDPNEDVREAVKYWMKLLKEKDPIKYLEIHMVALRNFYLENICVHLNTLLEDTGEDTIDLESKIDYSYETLGKLSKVLCSSLGVGKVSDKLLTGVMNFVSTGLDFAVVEPANLGFCSVLSVYLRTLSVADCKGILKDLDEKLNELPDIAALVNGDEANEVCASEVEMMVEFRAKLSGTGISRTRRRQAATTSKRKSNIISPDSEYEDEGLMFHTKQRRRGRSAPSQISKDQNEMSSHSSLSPMAPPPFFGHTYGSPVKGRPIIGYGSRHTSSSEHVTMSQPSKSMEESEASQQSSDSFLEAPPTYPSRLNQRPTNVVSGRVGAVACGMFLEDVGNTPNEQDRPSFEGSAQSTEYSESFLEGDVVQEEVVAPSRSRRYH